MGDLVSAYPSQVREAAVLSDLLAARWLREVVAVLVGAGLVGVTAQLSVPLPGTPVPVTGQTFAVLLCGASLGPRRGVLSLGVYLMAGVAGVGWFAGGGSGWEAPSFGYVVGFIPAAALVGYLAARGWDRTPVRTLAAMAAGTAIIYAIGVPWLAAALDVGGADALRLGMRPFLVGDFLKTVIAAGFLPLTWAAVRRIERE
jgi:biotin transport system substrate-specific component